MQPDWNKMLLHVGINSKNTDADIGQGSGGNYGARNFHWVPFFPFKLLRQFREDAMNNRQLTAYPGI